MVCMGRPVGLSVRRPNSSSTTSTRCPRPHSLPAFILFLRAAARRHEAPASPRAGGRGEREETAAATTATMANLFRCSGSLAPLLQRAASAADAGAAAATGVLTRGGRASSTGLPTAIGRRMHHVTFASIFRRTAGDLSFKENLTVVKNDTFIQIGGPFKKVSSLDVLRDLQQKVYEVAYELQLYKGPRGYILLLLVTGGTLGIGCGALSVSSDQEENQKTLKDVKAKVAQVKTAVKGLKVAICDMKGGECEASQCDKINLQD